MPQEKIEGKEGAEVTLVKGVDAPSPGSAGLNTQMPGKPTTITEVADASGGVDGGNLIQPDIDDQLFRFQSEDTPLMGMMLKAKKVRVTSPEVDHFMFDEPRASFAIKTKLTANNEESAVLPVNTEDKGLAPVYSTLLVKGVDGYDEDGQTKTPGRDLMLFVVGKDPATKSPIVIAVNGPKSNKSDENCKLVDIEAGTMVYVLGNAMYETQKNVEPDSNIPISRRVYLQKRGMNQIVSDYFDHQRKRVPFTHAVMAEQAIANFKTKGNRTLWFSRKSKFRVEVEKLGSQYVYTTEGLRWQFTKELQRTGKWTIEEVIALAKMFFTGEDVPGTAILLAGKDFLENIQCIDYSKHPEITVGTRENEIGWKVTYIHTVFGDIEIKREPTLDKMGYGNSAGLIGMGRLVHYQFTKEHSFEDRVDGEEATRSGIIAWDAVALKGSCHIWIDGDGIFPVNGHASSYRMWSKDTEPDGSNKVAGAIYYLLNDCVAINAAAVKGTMWKWTGSAWEMYQGEIKAA